jgi:Flp pilus assembly protein TadB
MQARTTLLVTAIALALIVIWWQHREQQAIRVEAETRKYQSDVEQRRLERESKDAIYRYQDSLRQAYIDQKLKENKKKNDKTRRTIDLIPGSPDSFRDSLWTAEWLKQDGPLW